MTKPNEKLVEFPSPSSRDVLTDVLREGARRLLATVIEAEVADYVAAREAVVDAPGHRRVVRNGYLPERPIQTPLGDIRVQQPRVRDRRPVENVKHSGRRSCRRICAGRPASKRCIRGCISRASARATSGRRSRRCWGRRPEGYPRPRSRA